MKQKVAYSVIPEGTQLEKGDVIENNHHPGLEVFNSQVTIIYWEGLRHLETPGVIIAYMPFSLAFICQEYFI